MNEKDISVKVEEFAGKLFGAGVTADKIAPQAITAEKMAYREYPATVTVELRRFEELAKKEMLLYQIENVLRSAESYRVKEIAEYILSVLPR